MCESPDVRQVVLDESPSNDHGSAKAINNTVALGDESPPDPEMIVRRRYRAGLANLFRLYIPLAASWQLFDNSEPPKPRPIAAGEGRQVHILGDPQVWRTLKESFDG